MIARTTIVALFSCTAVLIFVLELVRRKKMKEEYSILWITTAGSMLVFVAWDSLLQKLAQLVGAINTSSLLFFLAILFTIFFLLHFSIKISDFTKAIQVLSQELALLDLEHRELKRVFSKRPNPEN